MNAITQLISLALLVLQTTGFKSLSSKKLNVGNYRKGNSIIFASEDGISDSIMELQKCLKREYSSFFAPLESKFYTKDVEFIDPLNTLKGIDKYQANVDMLAGRTMLGSALFKDASIVLHKIEMQGNRNLQTRWTLQVTFKALPWQPRAKFTGVSKYTLNDKGIVTKQEDFWDSINLFGGDYKKVGKPAAIGDFLSQVQKTDGAEMSAPELPFELLRRGNNYEVRRYPPTLNIETVYEKRPEGYDRLGSYAGGSNEAGKRLKFFAPTLMKINDKEGERRKFMTWPMAFAMPGTTLPEIKTVLPPPTIGKVKLIQKPGVVVAVTRFEAAATEPIARGYTNQLLSFVRADGMVPSDVYDNGQVIVAQYDALFSLNKRRNEVWVVLKEHPWMS